MLARSVQSNRWQHQWHSCDRFRWTQCPSTFWYFSFEFWNEFRRHSPPFSTKRNIRNRICPDRMCAGFSNDLRNRCSIYCQELWPMRWILSAFLLLGNSIGWNHVANDGRDISARPVCRNLASMPCLSPTPMVAHAHIAPVLGLQIGNVSVIIAIAVVSQSNQYIPRAQITCIKSFTIEWSVTSVDFNFRRNMIVVTPFSSKPPVAVKSLVPP